MTVPLVDALRRMKISEDATLFTALAAWFEPDGYVTSNEEEAAAAEAERVIHQIANLVSYYRQGEP